MSRKRSCGSLKIQLIKKSRESALSAVQIFNNPNILFKSETYIVLMIIAWTYFFHAYYKEKNIDFRYVDKKRTTARRTVYQQRDGDYIYWDLSNCLKHIQSPISLACKNNLLFLIGLRNKIEHKMAGDLDDVLSARFQACCLNYNKYITKIFGEKFAIDKYLSFSLQFSKLNKEQRELIEEYDLPETIESYIKTFDSGLSEEEYNSDEYATRYLFVPKTANRPGNADRVIEFVKENSELAEGINKEYVLIKEAEKMKYLPGQIVSSMQTLGFVKFNLYQHTQLWKSQDARNPGKNFGGLVAGKDWYWYQSWFEFVKNYCEENPTKYK
jgi:hypothetical protein